ncbi:hypothetical protein AB0M23_11525 [Streptomyces sp. NPDC052077]|uniref:hypothetical protein n=1 Tax=Streptomyces sp. NPDC052077 TaxID=3154757 RepID=UPI003440C56B
MKIRRTLAVAAATAVIAPAALLVAPVAHAADDAPSSPVSESAPVQEEEAAVTTESPDVEETEEDTTTEESSPEETPSEDTTTDEETTPAATESATASPSATESASPTASPSTSVSPSASASASPSEGPAECDEEDMRFDDDLSTGLSGLPSKIVAGSGFHNFKLNVSNQGDNSYQRVDLGVFAAHIDEDDFFIETDHLTLQFKDPATGAWTDISLGQDDEAAGYLGYTDVRANESFSIDLRLSVDKKAPAGYGFAISIGMYADDEGNCVYSGDDDYYEFDILAAGSAPVDTEAKPQGGSKPLPTKPSGDIQIVPEGRLAETGSSSALPAIALTGGAAVALGVGAMFVVRRRRSAASGTTAV